MRPFQEFRLWARRAPLSERISTGLATLIVVALVAWLMVPDTGDSVTDDVFASGPDRADGTLPGGSDSDIAADGLDDGSSDEALPGSRGTRRARGGTSGATTETDRGGGSTSSTGGGGGDGGCVSPPGSVEGITDTEVRIAVPLVDVVLGSAANSLFDIPSPEEARADFEAVIAGINREGGVVCRTLVASYYRVNPADESQMMQTCREIDDAELFAVVDPGAMATRPAVLACFGQREIPYFGGFFITETARQQFYPYLFSFYTKEQLYKNTVFGLREIGYFEPANGFEKLGFIYRDCEREAIQAFRGWIREAGVPDNLVLTYSVGCPSAFANESDLAQAVLTFQREGVTHVTAGNFQGDIARFTEHAEQQGYRPQYGLPDEAILSIAEGNRAPNPDNIANALAITLGREAEQNTPGLSPTAGTQRCNAYYQAAGQPPVYEQEAQVGNACAQLWMFQAALGRAPEIHRAALQVGLQRTQSIDFSFPQGPNDFTGERVTTGGQFWRVAQFNRPDCSCWQVVQPEFQRGF